MRAERRRSSAASGWPRSSTIVASRRSGERIPRPRSRPSRKSAWARARPEYGERRKREQVAPASAEPGVAEQREQRPTERGLRGPHRRVEPVRNAERSERCLERRPDALHRRADDQDLLGRRAGPEELEDLVGDELEGCAGAGPLEETDRALGGRRRRRHVLEQRTLEMRERRMRVLGVARRQLLDPARRQRRQVGGGALERREREPAGLVLQRHRDVRAAGERLEQAPLRPAQILEAVGVDRPAVPGGELVRRSGRRRGHGGGHGPRARAGRAPRGSAGRARQGRRRRRRARPAPLRAPRSPCRARRRSPRSAADASRSASVAPATTPAQDQRPLRVAGERTGGAVPAGDPLEDVVECPDRSAEQCSRAAEQVALDPFDVRSGRHDQDRLSGQIGEVAIEEQGHFAGVGRPGQQRQGHRPILVLASDGPACAGRPQKPERARKTKPPEAGRCPASGRGQAATDFGLRPRRAVARPGMPVAQESQRSASFAPRRASEKDRRIVAPFPSSTSLPHLSQTRTVLRANSILRVSRVGIEA